ncbi:MAG: Uma2 family endonuclease [Lachnospiraceae bacterium]|nr:Uma2 family endonuclease [Lachnospiraceae bacterium]
MTIEEMKQRKIELGYSNKTLAEKSGVPIGTLQKIFGGSTGAPREETIRALEKVLEKKFTYEVRTPEGMVLREGAAIYNAQKKYTLDDYLALPEDERVELIDGVFYDMSAPTITHQGIGGYIYSEFLQYVKKNKGPCIPMIAPVDVQLDMDEYTIVQPDVLIVCERDKIDNKKRVYGAPDFVLEVLSPSTRSKDIKLKLAKYTMAGVREYWMIDPEKQVVVQYDLEHAELPKIYSFEEQVPVLIWEGKCCIDMKEMVETLTWFGIN